ncbi:MAG TPA: hypothetical protein VGB56_12530 [Flavisolibacter sp.]|jgi:hypothetical protein
MSLLLDERRLTTTELVETLIAQAKGRSAKTKKDEEDDLGDDELDPTPAKGGAKTVDDDDDDVDVEDDWEKGDDDLDDPDFEEFDLPKSKKGAGKKGEEDEDLKIEDDEEFKDLFNDGGSLDDEDDDF